MESETMTHWFTNQFKSDSTGFGWYCMDKKTINSGSKVKKEGLEEDNFMHFDYTHNTHFGNFEFPVYSSCKRFDCGSVQELRVETKMS